MSAAITPSVWTFAGNAKDIQRLLAGSAQDLPRAALLCLNHREAATLLGTAALNNPEAVTQAAARLRAAVGEAVVITGDEADYADTPQASGWLELPDGAAPPLTVPGADAVFTASAAAGGVPVVIMPFDQSGGVNPELMVIGSANASGYFSARLPAGNEVICTLRDPAVPALAERRQAGVRR